MIIRNRNMITQNIGWNGKVQGSRVQRRSWHVVLHGGSLPECRPGFMVGASPLIWVCFCRRRMVLWCFNICQCGLQCRVLISINAWVHTHIDGWTIWVLIASPASMYMCQQYMKIRVCWCIATWCLVQSNTMCPRLTACISQAQHGLHYVSMCVIFMHMRTCINLEIGVCKLIDM